MDLSLRITGLVVLACASCISIYYRGRANRRGGRVRHPAFAGWRAWLLIPARLAFLALIVACLVNPSWMRWNDLGLPHWLRWAAAGVAAVGVVALHWMFRHLGNNVTPVPAPRDHGTLVTTGPYRYIRHPLYTFATIVLIAIALIVDSGILVAFPVIACLAMALRTRREEALLIERFGDAYRDYQATTGRFLPRLIR